MAIHFVQDAGARSRPAAKTSRSAAKISRPAAKTLAFLMLVTIGFSALSFPTDFAYAVNRPMHGKDGGCIWAYWETSPRSGEFTLTITPDPHGNGLLSNWGEGRPQWFTADYDVYTNTKSIQIGTGVKAQTCYQMFGSTCTNEYFKSVESVDASRLDTSNVKNMRGVFAHCTNLESVDISGWSASAKVAMAGMFEACPSLAQLKISRRFMLAHNSGFDATTGFRRGTRWAQIMSSGSDAMRVFKEHQRLFDHFRALVTLHNSSYDARSNDDPKTYRRVSKIEYRLDGGTNSPSNPGVYMSSTGVASFSDATKAGYAFLGWYSRDGKTKVTSIPPYKVGDYVLCARFVLIGWQRRREDGALFYRNKTGEKAVGWQELEGTIDQPWSSERHHFYFNADGIVLLGEQDLYCDADRSTHRFFFDEKTGAQLRGWRRVIEDGVERWYYYAKEDGAMLRGLQFLKGGNNQDWNWFYFDEETGIQVRGWKYIQHENKLCYFGDDGAALRGWHKVFGVRRHFNEETGFLM